MFLNQCTACLVLVLAVARSQSEQPVRSIVRKAAVSAKGQILEAHLAREIVDPEFGLSEHQAIERKSMDVASCAPDCPTVTAHNSSLAQAPKTHLKVYFPLKPTVGGINVLQDPSTGWVRSETPEKQVRAFLYAALVIVVESAVFFGLRFITSRHSYVLVSSLCMIVVGSENFVNAYAGGYLRDPEAHIEMTFIMVGFLTVSLHMGLKTWSQSYKADWDLAWASSTCTLLLIVVAGILICCAQLCANIAFNIKGSHSGPNQALVCLNAIPVGVFFYFYAGEAPSRWQLFGLCTVFVGTLTMSGISHWTSLNLEPTIFLSMLFYVGFIICLRIIREMGIPGRPTMIIVNLVTGLIGRILFVVVAGDGHLVGGFAEFHEKPALLAWPFLNAIAGILSIWMTIYAYGAPGAPTGVTTAIIDSNSVPLTLMNFMIRGLVPDLHRALGIVIIVMGVITLAITDRVKSTTEHGTGETKSATKAIPDCGTVGNVS